MLEVVFLEGAQRGKIIRLNFQKAWFGRQPTCDFVLEGEGVSRTHFFIEKRGDDYVLIDNKSTNGTFVNGLREADATLRPGDQIAAGVNLMQVREAAGEPAGFRFIAQWAGPEGAVQVIERPKVLL